jgi:tyrosine-protein kinase Etk/Wzc
MSGLIKSKDDILNLLIRRKWFVLWTALILFALATWIIAIQPKEFQAFAAIQVEGPQVQNLGQGADTESNAAQIMQSIEHRLMTRENLLAINERHSIFPIQPGYSPDQMVSDLRQLIRFETVAGVPNAFGAQSSISAIIISAKMGNPETAARVANDLAQSILDMSNEGSATRAKDTFAFFSGEEERIRKEIRDQEAKLAAYQNENEDNLPVLAGARQQELASLDIELRGLEQTGLELVAEKTRLKEQGVQRETDRRRDEELDAAIQLTNDKADFASKRRAEVQASLAGMPEVEQAIAAQRRELTLLQDRYAAISQSYADAETALLLAERQQSERFMLLDRAVTPDNAVGPRNLKLIGAAGVASLLLALFLATILEVSFPVVRTSAQLERVMGIDALASIPEVRGLARRTSGAGGWLSGDLSAANLLAIAFVALLILLITSGIS